MSLAIQRLTTASQNAATRPIEFAVFLGATYFRAVAKEQGYGLSARGLAINTGDPKGEEFPAFTSFYATGN